MQFPKKLQKKLNYRQKSHTLRQLTESNKTGVDFSSNDYLGFAKSKQIYKAANQMVMQQTHQINGATGSRLLTGNHDLYTLAEQQLTRFYNTEDSLLFSSGYNANIGFFSSILQRGDLVLYDQYIHASIREGIRLGRAKSLKFKHNNLEDLAAIIQRVKPKENVYIVTESVFSMDGDSPDLELLSNYCSKNNFYLIVDEAHAVGVFSKGLCVKKGIEKKVFARIVPFGKALGCYGAAVLGSAQLKQFMINFSRSLIYSTGLSPHSVATIIAAHQAIEKDDFEAIFQSKINYFLKQANEQGLKHLFTPSISAIQCAIIPNVARLKKLALYLQHNGFMVKPILSPTVLSGQERLRFCLHTYNSEEEMSEVLQLMACFLEDNKS